MENKVEQSEEILEHLLSETDFTKPDDSKFSIEKRNASAFSNKIEIGNINIETPISFFLKKFYNKSMKNYVIHRQAYLNNCINDINYIFLMKEDILLTSNYEDENNKNQEEFHFVKINPILIKIDYRQVIKS